MKKKLIAGLMAVALTGTLLGGCGSSTSESSSSSSTEASSGSSGEASTGEANGMVAHPDQTYYMVTFMSGYSFWTECWRGFQDAAELLGVEAKYGGSADYDVNQAVTALEQITATNPTAMAVTAMDADAYVDPINAAIDQGIPVVTFDSDCSESKRTTFLGTSNYACGETAAKYIGEETGGSATVITVTSLKQTNIAERERGFEETVADKYSGIKYQVVESGTSESDAAAAVASALTNNPDCSWIFAQTQAAILGAQTALSEAGLTGKVKILGFDTDETTLDSIDNGEVEATITQSPYCEGFWSMIYCYMLANQECMKGTDGWYEKGYPSLPATGDSGSMVVTKDDTYMFRQSEESK